VNALDVFCEPRCIALELVHLLRMLARGFRYWQSDAKARAAQRVRSAPNRVCPWCGHRESADRQLTKTIEVLPRRGRPRYAAALVCSRCGEWWFNTCEHGRVIVIDDVLADWWATCRDCGERISWQFFDKRHGLG